MNLTDDELRRFGAWERASWEQRAAAYGASLGVLTGGSIDPMLRAARAGEGERLLDVGTGPGFVAAAAVRLGAAVTAVDQSAVMVRLATQVDVEVVQAGADALPFRDGSFTCAVAGYLLNHVPRAEAAVAELGRVLRPGGRFAFTVWDRPEANPVTGLLGPVVAELGLVAEVPSGPDPQRLADEGEVRRLLAGWDDLAVERLRWPVRVRPGAWFDAVADATPRTGAVLAQASPERRAAARERYTALAVDRYGDADGFVRLPAGAVLVSATRPARR